MSLRHILALSVLGVATSMAAEKAPTDQTPTFRSQSELVQVPVLVVRHGQHVTGLKAQDFIVLEDGVKQRIARFEEISASTMQVVWEKPAPGLYTNNPWGNQSPGSVTVLLFDLINTPHVKQGFVRQALLRFLAAVPDGHDPIMLAALTTKGLNIVHNFTTDPEVLRVAVAKMKSSISENENPKDAQEMRQEATQAAQSVLGGGDADDPEVQKLASLFLGMSVTMNQYREINRNELTLLQIQRLARSLAGVPGRKSLIWATGGITFTQGTEPTAGFTPSSKVIGVVPPTGVVQPRIAEGNDTFDRTWEILSDANIAVYTIDMEELGNPAYSDARSMGSTVESLQKQGFGLRAQAMNGFTDKTGGKYCTLDQKLENCFRNAIEDSNSYYMLAYYPSAKGNAGWRKLKVEVAGEGLKVHTRSGYYFRTRGDALGQGQDEVAEALVSPIDATSIPLAVRWVGAQASNSGKRTFELFLDSRSITSDSNKQNQFSLSITVAAHADKDQYIGKIAKTVNGHLAQSQLNDPNQKPMLFRDSLDLTAGENEVRFIVRDELSGRIGSVTAKVTE